MASYYAIAVLSLFAFSMSAVRALDDKKLQTTLYIKQTPATDQRAVGTDTIVINWVIKDGPAGNTIGHAEGLTTHANPAQNFWVTIMDLVFESGSLAGSTLKVMGLHGGQINGPGQWSVMGGTGDLTMARGIINYKIIQEDGASRTFEICIFAYYTSKETIPILGGIGIFP
ncbi:hypothetical protein SEVIR_6G031600v4 [Setaria viridis]|uniref:Dirigent protein n=1 Tax=Setaria viridis TaxID=4556 RepID=A0A4U6TZA1_SETVI|nr:uncharacterized protein LOC117861299 [Setaria viridis]TKW08488.1 hypothetical protein SEVIR_6G031600v2 [Setaria viridis]